MDFDIENFTLNQFIMLYSVKILKEIIELFIDNLSIDVYNIDLIFFKLFEEFNSKIVLRYYLWKKGISFHHKDLKFILFKI